MGWGGMLNESTLSLSGVFRPLLVVKLSSCVLLSVYLSVRPPFHREDSNGHIKDT